MVGWTGGAKIPVAVWAGGRLLAWAGRPDASPYLALLIGVVLLYLLFQSPYIGWLIWFIATWLGLGTMVLTGFGYLQTRDAGPNSRDCFLCIGDADHHRHHIQGRFAEPAPRIETLRVV